MREASAEELAAMLARDGAALRDFTPVARWLGCTVLEVDRAAGVVLTQFEVAEDARNPWGHVHGGARCSAIDETATLAAALKVGPRNFAGTLGLTVNFVRPLQSDRFCVRAEVTDRSIGVVAVRAQLRDAQGRCCDEAIVTVALRSAVSVGRMA
jgi:uncharacterized protein (TIGR00369 family)